MPRPPAPADLLPLTPVVLHVLLAVAGDARHGYAIAQEVEALSGGAVRMGPGTLYGSLQRMLAVSLIAEVPGDDDAGARRFYRATPLGRQALALELDRLARVVSYARARRLLPARAEAS